MSFHDVGGKKIANQSLCCEGRWVGVEMTVKPGVELAMKISPLTAAVIYVFRMGFISHLPVWQNMSWISGIRIDILTYFSLNVSLCIWYG